MRLDKFLCKSTALSREQAQQKIQAGEVVVNGLVATDVKLQVHENNHITLAGAALCLRASRYIMLHKPLNSVCSNVGGDYPSVLDWLGFEQTCDLHIAGRLDADTTGLVLVTDDGRWSFDIIRPDKYCEKVYRVGLRDAIEPAAIALFASGVALQGEAALTEPAKLELLADKEARLTITEGRYHQVKRMFAVLDNKVLRLHREQIGALKLDVEEGQWRYLTAAEVASFVAPETRLHK